MPATITRFVNTASTGGDGTTNNTSGATAAYASLSAALTAQARNLVTADEIALFLCSGSAADTTAVLTGVWAGFVCDATRYVEVRPNTGQEHGGAWNTGVYRLETTDSSALGLPAAAGAMFHVRVSGLQIRVIATTGTTSRRCFNGPVGISVSSILDVKDCVLRCSKSGGTATSHSAVILSDTQWATVLWRNNLILLDGTDVGQGVKRDAGINMYVHNCAVVGASVAYEDSLNNAAGTLQIKNSWAYQCTTFSAGAGVENGDYNSTDLAAATGGANDRVNQTFTFVNEAGGDYQLASTDTAARGHGVDLSADPNAPVTTDINGDPVNSPPDIGPENAAENEEVIENRWRIRRAAA